MKPNIFCDFFRKGHRIKCHCTIEGKKNGVEKDNSEIT